VKKQLRETVFSKRREILAMAKNQVYVWILHECQSLGLEAKTGDTVASKPLLQKWLKQPHATNNQFTKITQTIFSEGSAKWKEDMAMDLSEIFGLGYDPDTINAHTNNKGNGFLEKACTKALNNVRMDLRAIRDRANSNGPAPRIKRPTEEASNEAGVYKRIKTKVNDSVSFELLINFVFVSNCVSSASHFFAGSTCPQDGRIGGGERT
jgi:hypothetical protein